MRFLTTVLSCLLSLFGCDPRSSTTSITRVADNGAETLFSKTTLVDGVATFECFASASGDCHYRIYEERCATPAPVAQGQAQPADSDCRRETLDVFALAVGKRRQVEGLPAGFHHCVTMQDASGCG
ncbi:hypothetical protein MNQ95_08660 [Pseudoxanthomonas daejeonensis]|uniref:Secreted protein n=1 Tax=Pseudoxanthomonas daejeonensis TaxID=266062 RepID=A0ABQ6Z7F5_9GAMM|nr:hypothetical protein [Pseudoxanthomonas daejeonensis]KAF1694984.1 hypothetical protein CSC65_07115 [Pseudoxanthomonas daejeonensis]UNK56248.1 hypothetical protein MNQ95_08660 [Pseudoxanthomonas daejeonensis]